MGLAWGCLVIQQCPMLLYPEDCGGFVCPLLSLVFMVV